MPENGIARTGNHPAITVGLRVLAFAFWLVIWARGTFVALLFPRLMSSIEGNGAAERDLARMQGGALLMIFGALLALGLLGGGCWHAANRLRDRDSFGADWAAVWLLTLAAAVGLWIWGAILSTGYRGALFSSAAGARALLVGCAIVVALIFVSAVFLFRWRAQVRVERAALYTEYLRRSRGHNVRRWAA